METRPGREVTRSARHVLIRGRVQGVGFRWSTRAQAHELGVEGWVRNLPDRSVEVLVQGEAGSVEAMLAWLRRGPGHARVDHAEVTDAEPESTQGFEIR